MTNKRIISSDDILDMQHYAANRQQHRLEMIEKKKHRRITIGPYVTMIFECYDTMLYQVHEMLYTERGGDQQIPEELNAYNPLVPKGNEFSVTMMIEIDNPEKRAKELAQLGGIEEVCLLRFGEHAISASWENDVDRTTPEGKTSSVHFLHFTMTPEQAQELRNASERVILAIEHPHYSHMTLIPDQVRSEIINDL